VVTCRRCDAAATHVYAVDDHADDPAYYCADHAPGLAQRLARIVGVGRPGSGPPPAAPSIPPAGDLNDVQVDALQLLADPTVTRVRTHYGRTGRSAGGGDVVAELNRQTLLALVRRGYVHDTHACRPTPEGRAYLADEAVRRG
jgi:hypothetical protein